MWPFNTEVDLNHIDIHLRFWGDADPAYTVRLTVGKREVLEAVGVVQGGDFRLSNIVTVPSYRKKGLCTLVVGTLIGAARARQCSTFTLEDVSPRNIEAISIYRRFGAVAMKPREPGGHADHQVML